MNRLVWLMLALSVTVSGCGPGPQSGEEQAVQAIVDLPEPDLAGRRSLEEVVARRRSVRDFTAETLSLEELSQLLWAGQGITSDAGLRAAPSAGALYPVELYVVTPEGFYHYLPAQHRLEVLNTDDRRRSLSEAALGQEAVAEAPAVFVVTAVFARTERKYGERAERYVHLEAGHVGQNILLQAVGLGLGAVPIGAFRDQEVQRVLDLPADHEPLYLIPVGRPEG